MSVCGCHAQVTLVLILPAVEVAEEAALVIILSGNALHQSQSVLVMMMWNGVAVSERVLLNNDDIVPSKLIK